MKNIRIAIDGPAGSGKSTVAKLISKKLNIIYVDTGAMYRAIGLYCIENNIDYNNEEEVINKLDEINVTLKYENNNQVVLLNNIDVKDKIRTDQVSLAASTVSKYLLVREKMVSLQQQLSNNNSVVMDGRDIASVVIPDAEVKIYLTASPAIRAERRYQEYKEKGMDVNLETIKEDIINRDYQDSHRENSPLTRVKEAILIDSSELTIQEVLEIIISKYEEVK